MSPPLSPPGIDSPSMRCAGRELLSLALMDARNHTLQLLALHEAAAASSGHRELEPLVRVGGRIAWLCEWCIGRNPRRALGGCAPEGLRLASIEPMADEWFDPALEGRSDAPLPTLDTVRAYLLETLEGTLELLEKAEDTDDALHLFRAVLFHEDAAGEQLVVMAQTRGVALPLPLPAALASREPLQVPAVRWTLGEEGAGFAFALERPAHVVDVPAFDIDAQPVSWGQYVEFVADGGYDRPELWHPQGWDWAQTQGRRAPRHVEQIGVSSGAVTQDWFGRPTRMPGQQPAVHVSWWEADAWARWAGRRLPTEVEWEVAAHTAARRGFRWGDVHEWTAGTLRPWEGYVADAWSVGTVFDPQACWGKARVLRGASRATRARMKHPKFRGFALPQWDEAFVGFRTCAF